MSHGSSPKIDLWVREVHDVLDPGYLPASDKSQTQKSRASSALELDGAPSQAPLTSHPLFPQELPLLLFRKTRGLRGSGNEREERKSMRRRYATIPKCESQESNPNCQVPVPLRAWVEHPPPPSSQETRTQPLVHLHLPLSHFMLSLSNSLSSSRQLLPGKRKRDQILQTEFSISIPNPHTLFTS